MLLMANGVSVCCGTVAPLTQGRRLRRSSYTSTGGPVLTSCSSSDKTQYVDTCWKRRSTSLLVGLSFSLATATTLVSSPAEAAEDVQATTSKSAAPESELVRELLRRTEENKEKYKKERLQSYYERNYEDYFKVTSVLKDKE